MPRRQTRQAHPAKLQLVSHSGETRISSKAAIATPLCDQL